MHTDIGEYIVGAYLKIIEECDFVDYNVRFPGGGLAGLNELDVLGLDFKNKEAYLCEVTTHIRGLSYGDNRKTVDRIIDKHERQKQYAKDNLGDFKKRIYMFWSPVVPIGYLTRNLSNHPKLRELHLVINDKYTQSINALIKQAKKETKDTGNLFFRVLQILEHLKPVPS